MTILPLAISQPRVSDSHLQLSTNWLLRDSPCHVIEIQENCQGFTLRIDGTYVEDRRGKIHHFKSGEKADRFARQLIGETDKPIECNGYINKRYQRQSRQGQTQKIGYTIDIYQGSAGFSVEIRTPDASFEDYLRYQDGRIRYFSTRKAANKAARKFVARRSGFVLSCPEFSDHHLGY